MEQKAIWKWRGLRWLFCYIFFWLIAGGGAGILARNSPEDQAAGSNFIILFFFLFLIWCTVNDREPKSIPKKVGWVIGFWLLHSLLGVIFFFILTELGIFNDAEMLRRTGNMLAAYVLLYFTMRRSTFFVVKKT